MDAVETALECLDFGGQAVGMLLGGLAETALLVEGLGQPDDMATEVAAIPAELVGG